MSEVTWPENTGERLDLYTWAEGMRVTCTRYGHQRRVDATYVRIIARLTPKRAMLDDRTWIERSTGRVRPQYLGHATEAAPAREAPACAPSLAFLRPGRRNRSALLPFDMRGGVRVMQGTVIGLHADGDARVYGFSVGVLWSEFSLAPDRVMLDLSDESTLDKVAREVANRADLDLHYVHEAIRDAENDRMTFLFRLIGMPTVQGDGPTCLALVACHLQERT